VLGFERLIDLASERLGGAVIAANDEFFAPMEALLRPEPPVFRPGEYTNRGKWMDGWETRRRREPGHDWCVVRLGVPGIIHGIVVDTSHFTGNYPEACSLDGCVIAGHYDLAAIASGSLPCTEIMPRTQLRGDDVNAFAVHSSRRFTHVRLNIFPDGGVARLRVHGLAQPERARLLARSEIDLAAAENGGLVVECSDRFYGHPHNLIMPGPSRGMSDGWETKRRRGPGNEWTVVRLGLPGAIRRIDVDTSHFKGNAPASCRVEQASAPNASAIDPLPEDVRWSELLPMVRLQPHTRHTFEDEILPIAEATHIRLSIFPDGGIARLRLWGAATPSTG
jgi:allantoicase